ncbi:hypothetical protein Desti_2841 [Desulfomonile tiedjei DSM 6799]|uniref:Uncharacterized protein n=1 Tax=Desulfomonile tiedjei (strain ATCC 49306 / DSM 6799 / DCB-1) TaxID=706587 RepID=I4C7H0_DESTA|nr:hypothetical protein Desti_2841 [Desulfomonile tiedjei DSM 6799]
MKIISGLLIMVMVVAFAPISHAGFSFGLQRDSDCLTQCRQAPCIFPPVMNPCAVDCRIPGIQKQAVPCAFDTACPSVRLPCHGVDYGCNPYPLFSY